MEDYNIDVVICLDAANCMADIMDEVKENLIQVFYYKVIDYMKERDKEITQFRIKLIVVHNASSVYESTFYVLPNQSDELQRSIQDIQVSGKMSSIELFIDTIDRALNAEWTVGGSRRRHIIAVITNTANHRLEEVELFDKIRCISSLWEGTDTASKSKYQPNAGRLILLAPETEPWISLQTWSRVWPIYNWTESDNLFEDWVWF